MTTQPKNNKVLLSQPAKLSTKIKLITLIVSQNEVFLKVEITDFKFFKVAPITICTNLFHK